MKAWTDEERLTLAKRWAPHSAIYDGPNDLQYDIHTLVDAAYAAGCLAAVAEARGEASKIPPDMIECDKCGGTGTLLPPETLEAIDRIIEQTATEEPRDAER